MPVIDIPISLIAPLLATASDCGHNTLSEAEIRRLERTLDAVDPLPVGAPVHSQSYLWSARRERGGGLSADPVHHGRR